MSSDAVLIRQLVQHTDKAQGETNERLDKLIEAQEAALAAANRTNQLLEWVGGLLPQVKPS